MRQIETFGIWQSKEPVHHHQYYETIPAIRPCIDSWLRERQHRHEMNVERERMSKQAKTRIREVILREGETICPSQSLQLLLHSICMNHASDSHNFYK